MNYCYSCEGLTPQEDWWGSEVVRLGDRDNPPEPAPFLGCPTCGEDSDFEDIDDLLYGATGYAGTFLGRDVRECAVLEIDDRGKVNLLVEGQDDMLLFGVSGEGHFEYLGEDWMNEYC